MCNSFMAGASSATAPVAERIVGVAEVPLRPFWVLTYQHGARRAAGQRSRLYLPCPSELRRRLVQCDLQDPVAHFAIWRLPTTALFLYRWRQVASTLRRTLAVGVLPSEHGDSKDCGVVDHHFRRPSVGDSGAPVGCRTFRSPSHGNSGLGTWWTTYRNCKRAVVGPDISHRWTIL